MSGLGEPTAEPGAAWRHNAALLGVSERTEHGFWWPRRRCQLGAWVERDRRYPPTVRVRVTVGWLPRDGFWRHLNLSLGGELRGRP